MRPLYGREEDILCLRVILDARRDHMGKDALPSVPGPDMPLALHRQAHAYAVPGILGQAHPRDAGHGVGKTDVLEYAVVAAPPQRPQKRDNLVRAAFLESAAQDIRIVLPQLLRGVRRVARPGCGPEHA
jgi:hypothetical protein